ncbi:MAG: HD-GYP domain-containing protein [Magnetococcales bacterium]|nr:HD-GYP domain-containing protein [Magnetococcales bacterium]
MIKKVPVEKLKVGMFIHDFNHKWKDPCCAGKDPGFLQGQKKLENETQLQLVIDHGLREVYIDTAKGLDCEEAPTSQEVEAQLAAQLAALDDEEFGSAKPVQKVTMLKELNKAAEVKSQARRLVGNVLEDARLGKQVAVGPVRDSVQNMVESMLRNPDALLSLSLIKQKDEYTFMHSVNVGVFMISFCQSLGYTSEDVVDVGVGAVLHDIGKMKTPPEVLNKAGKLTDDEFKIMRQHVTFSKQILENSPGISEISMHVASQHHERYDGSGYPLGISGEAINPFGQMAAIVDVYDAITSDRCYHKGNDPHLALKRMLEWSKYHFNPTLYQQFVQCVGIYPIGTLVRLENGYLAVVIIPNKESLLFPVVKVVADTKKNKPVHPVEVNLMEQQGKPGGFKIVGFEDPLKWGINTRQFLPSPEIFANV